jgi:hypothetical protein
MDKVTHTERSLDWLKVAKSAGKHGIRYRTNAALVDFLNDVSTPSSDSGERMREAAYRQALEDVCNPLAYLQRMAEAEGGKLSGMAYSIANDIATVQRIARAALQESAR